MRRLIEPAIAAVALVVGALATVAVPAAAEVAPTPVFASTLSNLDTSTPGHVTGTITTDAKELQVFAANDYDDYYVDSVLVKDVSGSFSFDLETWGLNGGEIQFWACGTGWTQCSLTKDTYPFTASDLTPTSVSWPDDVTIGEEPYPVSAVDAAGAGGRLWVSPATRAGNQWGGPGMPAGSQVLASDGTPQPANLPTDGVTTLNLLRCNRDTEPTACRPTGLSKTISVDRNVRITSAVRAAGYVSASASFSLTLEAGEPDHPEYTGPVDLDWQVVGAGLRVAATGHASGVPLTNHATQLVADTSTIPEGSYFVRWTASATNDAYGTVTMADQELGGFTVDHTPPPMPTLTASASSVYPTHDGYRDYVDLHAAPGYVDGTSKVEIWDAAGSKRLQTLAWTSQAPGSAYFEYSWRGRRADGSLYPAGSYRTRVIHTDQAGNVAAAWGPTIAVARKHLSARDWRYTVTAKASRIGQYVGSCSSLRDPSAHGWAGSLGLFSNTRCVGQSPAGVVRTVHQVKAPSAVRYGGVEVDVYGGSPRLNVSDGARICLYSSGNWSCSEVPSTVGWRPSGAYGAVRWDHTVRWKAAVSSGKRYDVGAYRLRMRYWVLVADTI